VGVENSVGLLRPRYGAHGIRRSRELSNRGRARYFRPEFLNRLDQVVVFKALGREDLARILDLEFARVANRPGLFAARFAIVPDVRCRALLIEMGDQPRRGARPRRARRRASGRETGAGSSRYGVEVPRSRRTKFSKSLSRISGFP
jgi:hypothetical protein